MFDDNSDCTSHLETPLPSPTHPFYSCPTLRRSPHPVFSTKAARALHSCEECADESITVPRLNSAKIAGPLAYHQLFKH